MNEKCYVVMEDTTIDMDEYGWPRDWTNTLAVTKTKEKAFELIQKYSNESFTRISDDNHGVEKTVECDGWRITSYNDFESSTIYCVEFDLQ